MDSFRKNRVPSEMRLSVVLLLFLLQLSRFPFEVNSYEYNPPDNLAVNCGSSGNSTLFNRNWVGDVDTKLLLTFQSSSKSEAPIFHSSDNTVPWDSARLSYSNFTYSLPVLTSGPKFLRLHFYPISYATFEEGKALFSVKVGNNNNLTLLKDFNASLWVHKDEGVTTITKEYCINVGDDQRLLNITFLPSTTNNYYAFINAIELVSMPNFLYYTDPNDLQYEFKLLGYDYDTFIPYRIPNNKSLEKLYRVNVGDNPVPPGKDDTGMFRNWDNDFPSYLEKQYPQSVQTGYALHLNYRDNSVPNYTAPAVVYLTARSYGNDVTEDYNVTWGFEVDSQFTYMVRLHFCEFEYWLIQNEGDRVFQIFIDDKLAEQKADVISWSGGYLVPVHKDYAVYMKSSASKSEKVHLSIKLQRLPKTMTTKYRDVLLNGIEIFKISDDNNNLAGPNPEPIDHLSPPQEALQSKKSKSKTIIPVIVAVSCLILVASVICVITVFWRRRRESSLKSIENNTEGSSLPSHLCRYFTISEIRAATKNFDDTFIIGNGGFGNVYKGYIDGATIATPVAIKRLKQGSQQGFNEFVNEIDMLSQLRHIHLVSLIGYCNDGNEMILVYEFMQRGTLCEYLYDFSDNNSRVPLTWKQRLEILLGAARGLHYLHAGAKHNIIHRDVKSTNILLDEKWVAKVSDFGLSKVGPTGMSTTHVSTVVKGSLGYLDPEYYKRQRLTLKSDVYSFGVVLLEVLCARAPLVRALEKKRASLVDWVRRCHEEGVIDQTVDPFIRDSITAECLRCYCQMALSCLHEDGDQRPSMSDVVGALELALQLVAVSEEDSSNRFGGTQEKGGQQPQLTTFNVSSEEDGSGMRFTSSDEDYGFQLQSQTSSKVSTATVSSNEEQPLVSAMVFSEIGNPRA